MPDRDALGVALNIPDLCSYVVLEENRADGGIAVRESAPRRLEPKVFAKTNT